MKRHPALAPLSRDHHHALVLAQRLRRAGEQDAAGAAEAFLEHWIEEERLHFRLEENELFPLVERTLPEPALAALGGRLRDDRPRRGPAATAPAPPLTPGNRKTPPGRGLSVGGL
jgi:hypothetical protein